jgi:hypothetical protein
MIVVTPLHVPNENNPDKRDLCAEVRMRGNLDLRRESFVLGFRRWSDEHGRQCARLEDLGAVSKVKDDAKKHRREKKAAEKAAEKTAELEKARAAALQLLNATGACSAYQLGERLGLSNTAPVVKTTMHTLLSTGVCIRDARRGLVYADREVT